MCAVCENILTEKFADTKSICKFVMPNGCRFTESQSKYTNTAYKADFLRRFYFCSLDRLATFKGGQPLFVIHINQILSQCQTVRI